MKPEMIAKSSLTLGGKEIDRIVIRRPGEAIHPLVEIRRHVFHAAGLAVVDGTVRS